MSERPPLIEDTYSEAETVVRREAALRNMLAPPPQAAPAYRQAEE